MSQQILVDLAENSYPIEIEAGLVKHSPVFLSHLKDKKLFIISNPTVSELYLEKLLGNLKQFQLEDVPVYLMPDGEQYKNLQQFEQIIARMLSLNLGRDTIIIALGGGVVGDLAGFVAACYQRGIPFIQIPTTLLAQIDASVGGKTAVNHPMGKNMIGAFHQPQQVLIDPETLLSLPQREYLSGIGEALKYGLLADEALFEWMEASMDKFLQRDLPLLEKLIARCCQIKADIVAEDEKESGKRALLNLGHSFAHAIEAQTHYQQYLHGEAVAIGLHAAMKVSVAMNKSQQTHLQRLVSLLEKSGLPSTIPSSMDVEQLFLHMKKDKKNKAGKIRIVINHAIGDAELITCDDEALIKSSFPLRSASFHN